MPTAIRICSPGEREERSLAITGRARFANHGLLAALIDWYA
jgi:hypothetical protein